MTTDVRSCLAGPADEEETHSVVVPAEAEAVWELLHRVTVQDVPVARALFAVRALPARLTGRRPRAAGGRVPLLEQLVTAGFTPLAGDRPHTVALGRIGTFWKLVPEYRIVATGEEFTRFDTPGYAKAVMTFDLFPHAGGTRVSTTTMIRATDEAARRKFRSYWRVIRWAGGVIRKGVLRAVVRQARSRAGTAPAPGGTGARDAPAVRGTPGQAERLPDPSTRPPAGSTFSPTPTPTVASRMPPDTPPGPDPCP
ncbi:hypothetical protein [Streptomyces sp. NPDC018045]|uniref:hypothetical protein n=1 Tax=Streptomyces sp. NPDC018045 TaxID=3365037 RepID=UPI0037898426